MRLPVPSELCNQSVVLVKYHQDEIDRYHNVKKDNPIQIDNCLVHLATQYTGTNENRQLVANGVVYFYADCTNPFPELSKNNLGSKVTFEGVEYTVKTISQAKQPQSNDMFSYRLEVL
jgi:hypothetical protein